MKPTASVTGDLIFVPIISDSLAPSSLHQTPPCSPPLRLLTNESPMTSADNWAMAPPSFVALSPEHPSDSPSYPDSPPSSDSHGSLTRCKLCRAQASSTRSPLLKPSVWRAISVNAALMFQLTPARRKQPTACTLNSNCGKMNSRLSSPLLHSVWAMTSLTLDFASISAHPALPLRTTSRSAAPVVPSHTQKLFFFRAVVMKQSGSTLQRPTFPVRKTPTVFLKRSQNGLSRSSILRAQRPFAADDSKHFFGFLLSMTPSKRMEANGSPPVDRGCSTHVNGTLSLRDAVKKRTSCATMPMGVAVSWHTFSRHSAIPIRPPAANALCVRDNCRNPDFTPPPAQSTKPAASSASRT